MTRPMRLRSRATTWTSSAAIALWTSSATALALDPSKSLAECAMETIGISRGLTGAPIRSIAQTADGALWIGSFGGVQRYDGSRVSSLEVPPSLDVGQLVPRADGEMLIAARWGQPICARGSLLVPCPAGLRFPHDTRVASVHQDREGTLWMGSRDVVYEFTSGRLAEHRAQGAIPFGEVTSILRDRRGRVWIAGVNGLFASVNGAFVPWTSSKASLRPPVRSVIESARGHLWVSTDRVLARIADDGVTTWAQPDLGGWRSTLLEDRDGTLWMGSQTGLYPWIGTQTGLMRFRDGVFTVFTRRDGLPDDDVTALFEDREGSLWMGTRSGLLAQFTDRTVSTNAGPPSLRKDPIETVVEDEQGTIWLGSWRGLTRWKDGGERTYTVADGLPSDRVYAVYPDRGFLWVAAENGLLRMREGKLQGPVWPAASPTRLVSLYRDSAGALWIGTDTGLARLRDGRMEMIPPEAGFSPGQVRSFGEDDAGILWVTSEGGLGRLIGSRLVRGRTDDGVVLPADRGMFKDADGSLWFGAGEALVRRRRGAFRVFTEREVVPPGPIYQILADDHGHLWLSTNRAIVRLAKRSLDDVERGRRPTIGMVSFEVSDQRAEVAGRRSRMPGSWKTRDGRLWFATLQGIATIDPTRVRTNSVVPAVVIDHALVDGRRTGRGRPNEFPPGSGNLEFDFGGVTLLEPRKAVHRYRLEGFDEDWVNAGPRRVANYTRLPPGPYRFRVQASNADGVWNEEGATLELRLAPHFYQTAWFYSLCVAAFIAAALAAYRLRLGRLRQQYLAVFTERARVARELHDSLLQGMSAAVLLLDHARAELPPSANGAARRLHVVQDAIKNSLEEARRVVWNLREQPTDSDDLGVALSRLAARLADGGPVRCQVSVEGAKKPLPHDVQGTLFRIAQEALANAVKHAQARHIDVGLRYADGAVTVSVADDGRGFDPERAEGAPTGHFGLLGMRERAHRVGGSLAIESGPGRGTRIHVSVPTDAAPAPHV